MLLYVADKHFSSILFFHWLVSEIYLHIHKADLYWWHLHFASYQPILWESVLKTCWILSWWTVYMVITGCKMVMMINSACIGLCHGYRDHNYGRRYWCLRELGLFCKYVWVRKGNLYSFIVKFHWAVIFFELLWGSSHWGKKGQEKRERVPFCSGLTVCSDAVKTGWSVLLEAAAFLSCIPDSGHVHQVSLSYSATRILHSTLHSSPRVVLVEEHVSRLVSVTCSVVC